MTFIMNPEKLILILDVGIFWYFTCRRLNSIMTVVTLNHFC